MSDFQKACRCILGWVVLLIAIALGYWLPLRTMLYGGIMQAIENWQVDNPAVVWGIIRAALFSFGFIPTVILAKISLHIFE